jgi:hypothetical protein
MTPINIPRPHTAAPARPGRRSPRPELRAGRRVRASHLSQAVVAGYINELTQYRRSGLSASGPER